MLFQKFINYSLRWLHVVCQLCLNADQGSLRVKELCRSDRLSGIMALLLLWSWDAGRCIETEREEASMGRAFRPQSVSTCTFQRGVLEVSGRKPRRWISQFQSRGVRQMHAGIDLTLIMPRNETHLGSNSVCVNTSVSLSDRWVCHVYVNVQRTREYLPSLSISLGCTISVCFMSCSRCHRRGQKVTST